MNSNNLSLSILVLSALASCASAPKLSPIDNALLVEASSGARAEVVEARSSRDTAEDAYAVAQRNTKKADEQVELARASLKTVRSQLSESKVAVKIAESSGTPSELAAAKAMHAHSLARADETRELLAVRKRELDLARATEKFALENHRLSTSELELKKAEAIQDVELMAAERIPVKDYRRQVFYHREEVEIARTRVATARALLDEAQQDLEAASQKVRSLTPAS